MNHFRVYFICFKCFYVEGQIKLLSSFILKFITLPRLTRNIPLKPAKDLLNAKLGVYDIEFREKSIILGDYIKYVD